MTTTSSRGRRAATATCLAALLGSASAFAAPSWLQPAYDAAQTWNNPHETTLRPGNVARLQRVATLQPGYNWVGPQTQAGGALYLCSDRYGLGAIAQSTGALRWSTSALGGNCQGAVLAGSVVYATAWPSQSGTVISTLSELDQSDGSVQWQVDSPPDPPEGPSWLTFNEATLSQGTLFVSSGRSLVSAYNAADGHLRWRYETGSSYLNNQVAAANGIAYTTTWNQSGLVNQVFANDGKTGALLWTGPTDTSYIEYPATIVGGRVFAVSDSGSVYAFDAASGTPQWNVRLAGYISTEPVATPQALIVNSFHSTILALDPATGATLWSKKLSGTDGVNSNMVLAGSVLYCTTQDFEGEVHLAAFDARTGVQLLKSTDTLAGDWSTVSVAGGRVYIGYEGTLAVYALP